MKIALIIPFAKDSASTTNDQHFKSHIRKPEEITVFWTGTIYPSETASDVTSELPQTLESIKAAEREGFNAAVIVPHMDEGLEESRELVRMPVVATIQVALHIGLILGHRVCVVKWHLPSQRGTQYKVRGYGLDHLVSVRAAGMSSAKDVGASYSKHLKDGTYGEPLDRFVATAIKGIEEDDCTVIVVGSGSMLWLVDAAREKLKEKGYDVPVISPIPTAVEIARSLVNLGLTHSWLAYPGFKWAAGDAHYRPSNSNKPGV